MWEWRRLVTFNQQLDDVDLFKASSGITARHFKKETN